MIRDLKSTSPLTLFGPALGWFTRWITKGLCEVVCKEAAREEDEFVTRASRLAWIDAHVGISKVVGSILVMHLFLGGLGRELGATKVAVEGTASSFKSIR